MGTDLDRSLKIRPANEKLVLPAQIQHNPVLQLSNLDHYVPVMVTTLYVYEVANWATSEDLPQILSDSLAKTLVLYHPVAGRIKENNNGKLEICYDQLGVPFAEAYADNDIHDLGSFALVDGVSWGKLMPDFSSYPGSKYGGIVEAPLLHVQVTQFKSGGFTLGIAFNHMIADGMSAGQFFESWSRIARGVALTNTPNFERSFLRPRSSPQVQFGHLECFPLQDISKVHDLLHQGPFEYRTFSFPLACIQKLQRITVKEAEAEGGPLLHKCTGFEALAALVWQARTRSLNIKPAQMLKLVFSMSARPQLPKENTSNYMGNLVLYPALICNAGDVVNMSLCNIVRCLQRAKKTLSLEYVRSAIDHYEITRSPPTHDHLTFCIAQWSWLGLHDGADFGWGTPLYVGPFKPPPNSRELGGILLTTGSKEKGDQVLFLGLPSFAMPSFSSLISNYLLASANN